MRLIGSWHLSPRDKVTRVDWIVYAVLSPLLLLSGYQTAIVAAIAGLLWKVLAARASCRLSVDADTDPLVLGLLASRRTRRRQVETWLALITLLLLASSQWSGDTAWQICQTPLAVVGIVMVILYLDPCRVYCRLHSVTVRPIRGEHLTALALTWYSNLGDRWAHQ